jgi:hypothetical protein
MFGFGMSDKDKWHLEQAEKMMECYALLVPHKELKKLVRQMFDNLKAQLAPKYGAAMYAEDTGDKLIATKKDFVEKRLAVGLSIEDIRSYWNQTLLMQDLRYGMIDLPVFIELNMLRQMRKSEDDIANIMAGFLRDLRKNEPRWGDPDQWNPDLPANKGFSTDDADIHIEFFFRVRRWQLKTPAAELRLLLAKYSSYNAMLRDLINKGSI